MPFECPECHGNKTLRGAYFETCANCGYSSVEKVQHLRMLIARIEELTAKNERLKEKIAATS